MVERLAKELDATGAPSAQNLEVPPDDATWGGVFPLVGSDAMRGTGVPRNAQPSQPR